MQLVAVVLTLNEATHISECVASLRGWCDAVIVWDSGSTDATQQLAYLAGAQVVERPFDNYAAQRQAALDTVNAEWILFIDADERVPQALREELLTVVADDAALDGYWLARRNIIAGHETRGSGFFPDYQLRLLRRTRVKYDSARKVHEIVEVEGETGQLSQPLVHYNYGAWADFYRKQPTYARYEAKILRERGIKARPHNFILQPIREFWRRFVKLKGYRDGFHGLKLAVLLAWYYGFMPYWYLMRGQV